MQNLLKIICILRAKFIGIFGEAELAELQLMQAKESDENLAKAA